MFSRLVTMPLMVGIPVDWPSTNQTVANPATSDDPNDAYMARLVVAADHSLVNPNFSNVQVQEMVFNPIDGLDQYDVHAKTSFFVTAQTMNARACGQRFLHNRYQNSYGMGDSFLHSEHITWGGGVDCGGDEGQGVRDITAAQQGHLNRATIASIIPPTTINTTLAQAVTAVKGQQTVSLMDVTGVAAGQWITIDPQTAGSTTEANMECVKVMAVDPVANTITAIFNRNHLAGVPVLPATVLSLSSAYEWGQHRWLVNLSQPSYAVGTVAGTSGSTQATGLGTTWTNGMVGGSATNVGLISFAADDYSGSPFGAGVNRLRDWYPIASVTDATHLNFLHRSAVGLAGYTGLAMTQGAYEVRSGCRIATFDGTDINSRIVVLPYNTFPWAVGDSVECALSPDIDFTGDLMRGAFYSAGGTYRQFVQCWNVGRMPIQNGFLLYDSGYQGSGYSFGVGFDASAHCNVAFQAGRCDTAAFLIPVANSLSPHIMWGNPGNYGLYWDAVNQVIEVNLGAGGHTIGTLEPGVMAYRKPGQTAPTFPGGKTTGTWYAAGSLELVGGSTGPVIHTLRDANGNLFKLASVGSGQAFTISVAWGGNGTFWECVRFATSGTFSQLGFFGAAPVGRPVVTGSRSSGAALASLLTALAGLGLITDNTVA